MTLTARRCSNRALILSAVCLALIGSAATRSLAADAQMPDVGPLRSGPQAGEQIHSFFVRAVTGPHRNRSVCYVCRYGSRPVAMVFVQKVDPRLPALLKAIDGFVDRNRLSGLRSFGVLVTDDSRSVVPILQTMAFDERIRMPLTASTSTIAGRDAMSLNEKAATTLVLYRDQRAVTTLAFPHGKIDDQAVERTLKALQSLIDSTDN